MTCKETSAVETAEKQAAPECQNAALLYTLAFKGCMTSFSYLQDLIIVLLSIELHDN